MNLGTPECRQWSKRLARVIVSLVFFGGCTLLLTTGAAAHATLQTSDPLANAVLATSPSQITMFFTEPLEYSYSKAELYDQQGNVVSGVTSHAGDGDNSLVIDLTSPLDLGTYSVAWQTLSAADGHEAQGYFAFSIGSQTAIPVVPPTVGSTGRNVPLWVRSFSRWAAYIGLAAVVAIWPVWVLVLQPAFAMISERSHIRGRRIRRLGIPALMLAVVGDLFALLAQAATLPSGSYGTRLWDTLTDTRYGRLWALRIALLVVSGVVLRFVDWETPLRRRWAAVAALLVSAILPLPISLNAHASALSDGRNTAIAFDLLHLLGAALWIGGLFLLIGVLLPEVRTLKPAQRREVLARALPRFSVVALASWVVLGLTGLYSAWLQVGNLKGLRDTAYGHSLIAKLLLLIPVLVLASFNLLVVTRRLRRTGNEGESRAWIKRFRFAVLAEVILVVAVLFTVGRLTSQQPARDVLSEKAGQVSLTIPLKDRKATLSLSPGAVGTNHYRLEMSGDTLPDKTEALLRLTFTGKNIGEKQVTLERVGGNAFEAHGAELSITGDWTIDAVVRLIGEFNYEGSSQLTVGATPATASPPRPAWRFSTAGIAGLLLVVVGIAACSLAWFGTRTHVRRQSAGLGAVGIALGALVLLGTHSTPTNTSLTTINPIPADSVSVTRGQAVFQSNCASCHGVAGKGDGPAGANLNPRPADLTGGHSLAHPDGQYFLWIASGKPNTAMPGFNGSLSDQDIWDVINYVRVSLQGRPSVQASPAPSQSS